MSASSAELFAGIMPFVATVETRSFTQAARLLGVTPSAISRAIGKLEAQLGIRLLQRTSRSVTLTPEGSLFYRGCQAAVSSVREAADGVTTTLRQPHGTLRVSLPLALGELVIMPALPGLVARHAGLSVEARLTDHYVDLVAESIDAVVRIGEPRPSGLKRHRLPAVPWVTVAAPAYLAARGTPSTPAELLHHNCLHFLLPSGKPQPWSFRDARGRVLRVATQGNLSSDHPGGLLQASTAGLGVLQAHRYIAANALAEGRVVELLQDFRPAALTAAVLFLPGRERTPNIRAFIAAISELMSGQR